MRAKGIDLSVIITAHSEGILIHKTVMSVRRAIESLNEKYSVEIILHVDNPDTATKEYIEVNKNDMLRNIKIFFNQFGDPSASRNFSVSKAHGKYISVIDADDLMSKNWLRNALDELSKNPGRPSVAHPEYHVFFDTVDYIIRSYEPKDKSSDSLLSVWSNRWSSVIVMSKELFLKYPYPRISNGYGYEDWWLNNTLTANDVTNIVVPKTAIFVRRRESSYSRTQSANSSILFENKLLSFSYIRSLKPVFSSEIFDPKTYYELNYKNIKRAIKNRIPQIYSIAQRSKDKLSRIYHKNKADSTPAWLKQEWQDMHLLENSVVMPTLRGAAIRQDNAVYSDFTQAGALYKIIVDQLRYDDYDFLLIVPWLIIGGADKYSVELINQIQTLRPNMHIMVIATIDTDNPYANNLDERIDFVNFGRLSRLIPEHVQEKVMEHIIENGHIKCVQIINSEFGYNFIKNHKLYFSSDSKLVVGTAFGRVPVNGRLIGYIISHIPKIYDSLRFITSDNSETLRIWRNEYGFDPKKLLLHSQKVIINDNNMPKRSEKSDRLKILWASRIAPEKLPYIVSKIGQEISSFADIDMFGWYDPKKPEYRDLISKLPCNVHYKGPYHNGLANIPNQESYDLYLYTSEADGMPNAPLEAIQLGLPIVSSSVGGVPDILKNNVSGLLVKDPYDVKSYVKCISRLKDGSLRKKLASNAIKHIKETLSASSYESNINSFLDQLGL
jgi:glycosyltransferase involved in cell wall biosynthesis